MNHPCKMLIIQKADMMELQSKEVKDEQMIPLCQPRQFLCESTLDEGWQPHPK